MVRGIKLDMIAKCKRCKKEFNRTIEWQWFFKDKICCSYHCMRAFEKEAYGDRKTSEDDSDYAPVILTEQNYHKPIRLGPERKQQIVNYRKLGFSSTEIASMIGCSKTTVVVHCRNVGLPFKHINDQYLRRTYENHA